MNRLTALFGRVFVYRRGRLAAGLLLLAYLALAWISERPATADSPGQMPARIANAIAAPLAGLRQALFDSYLRSFPRIRQSQTVAVVAVDEKSLRAIGQWPWPRDQLAELVDAIAARKPAAIGLDLYMPEADQTTPSRVADRLPIAAADLARELRRLPAHEARLAQALHAAPTVLGAAAFEYETPTTSTGLLTTPVRITGADPLPFLRRYPYILASLPELQAAAHGQALTSTDDKEAIVRRIPLVAAIGELVVPALSMEMLRLATGSASVEVVSGSAGVHAVGTADLAVRTQPNGDVWLHFARLEEGSVRNVSAADVMAGNVNSDAITGKLVLIGLTGLGLNDYKATPLGERVPGIEIQAQLLESFLDGRFLLRPTWIKPGEMLLLLVLGCLMIWLVPNALRVSASADAPRRDSAGWLVSAGIVLLFGMGYLTFWSRGWLFDAATPALGFALLLASLVSSSMLQVERDNQQLLDDRQRLRDQTERLAGEMEAARRIQLGSLPDPQQAFAAERRFGIATLIEPARQVGGDLYDFYMVDAQRLFFIIGDVSGKGIPAALFMAVAKALTRSLAMRLSGGPAQVIAAVNDDLARENAESLFVTMLLGVMDVQTGEIELVNAGHDAPWRLRTARPVEQLAAPHAEGGPPLCMLPGFAYRVQRIRLQPGDRLCLVTDGITEAASDTGEFYGNQRLRAALESANDGTQAAGAEQVVRQVRDDVRRFVAGAEPSDDLTMLVLQWNGPLQ